jgi:hypothetical protein
MLRYSLLNVVTASAERWRFDLSITVAAAFNALGYGWREVLTLNLVYNPASAASTALSRCA